MREPLQPGPVIDRIAAAALIEPLTLGVAAWLAIRGPVRAVRIREASR